VDEIENRTADGTNFVEFAATGFGSAREQGVNGRRNAFWAKNGSMIRSKIAPTLPAMAANGSHGIELLSPHTWNGLRTPWTLSISQHILFHFVPRSPHQPSGASRAIR
jgi:hypothetical protein